MAADNTFLRQQISALQFLDADSIELLFQGLGEESPVEKGQLWINEGDKTKKAYVMADGWAVRYKLLGDGRRQILNFYIPGDMIGYFSSLFKTSVYSVEALTPIRVQSFSLEYAFSAFRQSPQLAVALSWLAAQGERQLSEHLVRVGRRSAQERMAHLFVELNHRLLRVGVSALAAESLPLTQPLLADALGLSHVHAHRTFRELVRKGLVSIQEGRIKLHDTNSLSELAGFEAAYLEQNSLPSHARAVFSSHLVTSDKAR